MAESQVDSSTRLRGRLLLAVQAGWFAIAVLTVGLFILAVPRRYEELQAICTGAACREPQLSIDDVRVLQLLGLSRATLALYSLGLEVLFAAVHFVVAIVIFARRSSDRMALLVALMLMTFGPASFTGTMNALAARNSGWQLPVSFLSSLTGPPPDWLFQSFTPWRVPVGVVLAIGQTALVLFFFLFPNGRFVPRWGILLAALWIAWQVPAAFMIDSPVNPAQWPQPLSVAVWAGFLLSFVSAQVYRYRRVSDLVEQQQTKWVVFGVTVALGGFLGAVLLAYILSALHQQNLIYRMIILTLAYLFMLQTPLSIGFAILRSRLWAIDVIINRALVYGALTAVIAVLYLGGVIVLQSIFRAVIGQELPSVVAAISTLAIAAIFNPLRRRVQDAIDARFYRHKYDTAQVLASITTIMRDEVDLDRLSSKLLTVVDEAVQPTQASLWLKTPGPKNGAYRKRVQ